MEYTGFGFGGFDEDALTTKENYGKNNIIPYETDLVNRDFWFPENTVQNDVDGLIENIDNNITDYTRNVLGTSKKISSDVLRITEKATPDPVMEKYAELAYQSYNEYEGKALSMNDENWNKISELSNKNNLVLETTDEVHMSFRGSQEFSDWTEVNSRIFSRHTFGGVERTARYSEAENQLLKVIEYAKKTGKRLTISGHSAGGFLSYEFGQKYDIEGFHFQPGISMKQVLWNINKTFSTNLKKQFIYKTHFDLPSLRIPQFWRYFVSNENNIIKLLGTKSGLDNSLVKTHSLEHFLEGVKFRNTPLSSMGKSLSLFGGLALQGFFTYQDLKNDTNNVDKGIDITKNILEFAGGLAIGTMFAPELIVPALISTALFNVSLEHLSHEVRTSVHYVSRTASEDAKVLQKAIIEGKDVHGKNIGKRISGEFKEANRKWRKTGSVIKHFFGW